MNKNTIKNEKTTAPIKKEQPKMMTVLKRVYVRSQPSKLGMPIRILEGQTEVPFIEYNEDKTWVCIKKGLNNEYIKADFLKFNDEDK